MNGYRVKPNFLLQLFTEKVSAFPDINDDWIRNSVDSEFNAKQDAAILDVGAPELCWWSSGNWNQHQNVLDPADVSLHFLQYLEKVRAKMYSDYIVNLI